MNEDPFVEKAQTIKRMLVQSVSELIKCTPSSQFCGKDLQTIRILSTNILNPIEYAVDGVSHQLFDIVSHQILRLDRAVMFKYFTLKFVHSLKKTV